MGVLGNDRVRGVKAGERAYDTATNKRNGQRKWRNETNDSLGRREAWEGCEPGANKVQ